MKKILNIFLYCLLFEIIHTGSIPNEKLFGPVSIPVEADSMYY